MTQIFITIGMLCATLLFEEARCFYLKNPTLPVILISAVIALTTLKNQAKVAKAKNSLDFQTAMHSAQALELNNLVRVLIKGPCEVGLADIIDEPLLDSKYANALREVLNTWERASVAIQSDIYDEEVLFSIYGSTLITIYDFALPLIRDRQKQNPRVYKNLDSLALRWKIKLGR